MSTRAPERAEPPARLPAPMSQPAPDADVAARQEWAAERLLEDERLRGELTDDEFQPLLDWALATVDRVAAETAGQTEEVARRRLEAALDRIRDAIHAGLDPRDGQAL